MSQLKLILLDDDGLTKETIKDSCATSPLVKITGTYTCPLIFLENASLLDYDFLMLEISMQKMDGLTVAKRINNKPVIFTTCLDNKFKEALALSPIDILSKPLENKRIQEAFKRAHLIINGSRKKKTHELFNIAEGKGKLMLNISDVLYVTSDIIDYRNKTVYLRDGKQYTLMNCKLEKLLNLSNELIQVNKAEAISIDAIKNIAYDVITLKILNKNDHFQQITLSRVYRKNLLNML